MLFLAPYPTTAASTRFRVTQFLPYLRSDGIECVLSPFLSERAFRELYDRRSMARKALQLLAMGIARLASTGRARKFDAVVVQRGAMLFGPPLVEWAVARLLRRPLVYDFDDAIWLSDAGPTWGSWAAKAKFPGKTAQIIRMARHVIVCNEFTRRYALRHRSDDVTVIPTVVDDALYRPVDHPPSRSRPVVGWIGTHSTARYLELIRGPLEACGRRHDFTLRIVGAGRDFSLDGVQVENKAWRLEQEVSDYQSLDIGLYPVADDEWGKGKTGFKPVVYMSCGVPCISSPVGGVTGFVRHGTNGLFASSPAEWEQALEALLTDPGLRRRLGDAGRRTVEEQYSLRVHAPRLAAVLRRAVA